MADLPAWNLDTGRNVRHVSMIYLLERFQFLPDFQVLGLHGFGELPAPGKALGGAMGLHGLAEWPVLRVFFSWLAHDGEE